MTGTAQFSPCGIYRYSLTRQWGIYNNVCTFIMLNPSTADATKLDPTITRCIGFARSWSFDGLHVVNLFAWRATNPEELYRNMGDDIVGEENNAAILAAPRKLIICAWGNDGGLQARGDDVVKMLHSAGAETHCLGLTKAGHPRHPLYLRADTKPVLFEGYRE